MQYKIGKIRNYDGQTGEIVTDNEVYMFLESDILPVSDSIENNDIVKFRNEKIDETNRAFFVQKLSKNIVLNNK